MASSRRGRTPPPAASSARRDRRDREQRVELLDWQNDEIRAAFNLFDADATGQITYREMRAAMRALDYAPRKSELRGLVAMADPDETGFVTFDGFSKIMSKHAATVDVRAEVDKIFDLFAGERGARSISRHNLRDVARELGEQMDDEAIDTLLELLSSSGGDISRDDFLRIMVPKRGADAEDLDLVDD